MQSDCRVSFANTVALEVEQLLKWLNKHFWDMSLKGTLYGFIWHIFASIVITGEITLGITLGTLLAVVFANPVFYAFAVVWLSYGLIRLTRYILECKRRSRDARDERLVDKLEERLKNKVS